MKKQEIMQRIWQTGLVPAVRVASADDARRAIDALLAGGVTTLEITMSVPKSLRVIEEALDQYGDEIIIGAGTVLDAETARACLLAGAHFIVSPSLNLEVIRLCRRYGRAIFPGALTPTEILEAWEAGADCVKIFPAAALGGASYLKALKAPLPQIELMPMGGVTLETAAAFIKAGAFALGVGSDLVDAGALRLNQPEKIIERARQFTLIIAEARSSLL